MAAKDPAHSAKSGQMPFFNLGQDRTEAAIALQKELLETYEQASRAWLERVKSEVELWSQLAAKLSGTRSVPEALQVYQKSVTERMQMAAEDGRRLFNDCQETAQKINRALANGLSTGGGGSGSSST
jgi:hypothetical protein